MRYESGGILEDPKDNFNLNESKESMMIDQKYIETEQENDHVNSQIKKLKNSLMGYFGEDENQERN